MEVKSLVHKLVRPSHPRGKPTRYWAGGTTGKFFGSRAGRRPLKHILRPFIPAVELRGILDAPNK